MGLTMYLDYENEEKKHNLISTLETIAESFRERIVFTYMDGNTERYSDIFERWGIDSSTLPVMMLSDPTREDMYKYEGDEINEIAIGEFCNAFLNHELKPFVIKQTIPENNDSKVKTVVHDTWRSIVHDPSSDVVVFFYLPLSVCSHCVKFLELYEKIVEDINIPNVVFTKIDMHANAQVPGIRVANFPTVQIYPMTNKFQEITFSGPRKEEELKNWLIENL